MSRFIMSRKPVIGGNWKCNGTVEQMETIIKNINDGGDYPDADIVIAVPAIHISKAIEKFRKEVSVSSQDCGLNKKFGAFTGELSPALLIDAGVNWTLTGHSERRVGFGMPGETNEIVGQKTAGAIAEGMTVMACIGEQLAERENGTTMVVCAAQLEAIAKCLKVEDWSKVVIAYEPVWAIGTGKVATPEQAEQTHKECREWIAANVTQEVADAVRIVYGGSVKGANCEALMACPNIDGFLVGGASLLPEFVKIIQSAR